MGSHQLTLLTTLAKLTCQQSKRLTGPYLIYQISKKGNKRKATVPEDVSSSVWTRLIRKTVKNALHSKGRLVDNLRPIENRIDMDKSHV